MKKFTGNVVISTCDYFVLNKMRTCVEIHYKDKDAPIFEKGQVVIVESQHHFPITTSTWTNENGQLITDRVRGKYYMCSEWVKVKI